MRLTRPPRPALALATLLVACSAPPGVEEEVFSGATMGTVYTVKVVAEGMTEQRRGVVGEAIEAELELVNSLMSTWIPDSELSRLNAWTDSEPFPLSPETLEVLSEAMRVSEATGGAFDVTVGLLVEAWGFGASERSESDPTEEEIAVLRERVGWRMLEIDPASGSVRKGDPLLATDLSAIAKGYAVDRVAQALSAMDLGRHMVEIGGEVRVAGLSGRNQRWRIGIERPESGSRSLQRVVSLDRMAIATSGDYRNFVVRDGRRLSHTIDPRTGRPVQHSGASVTVVSSSCLRADAWATALMVLGPEEGYRLAVERSLAALFLSHDGAGGFSERSTPELDRLLAEPEPPDSR